MRGVWCVFVDDGSGEDHYRILSTHATRDGAAVSANQVNRAEAEVRDSDPLNPPGPGDETRSHVRSRAWLPYKSRGVHHPVEGWE